MDDGIIRLTAFVHGHVQGVGFRWFTRAKALELGLVGTATNLTDGRVEVGNDVGGPAQRQQQLRALGQRCEPQLGEAGGFDRRPRLVGEVRERLPGPAAQRRAVQLGGLDVGGIVLAVTADAGRPHS